MNAIFDIDEEALGYAAHVLWARERDRSRKHDHVIAQIASRIVDSVAKVEPFEADREFWIAEAKACVTAYLQRSK